jgi:hypothetical protein
MSICVAIQLQGPLLPASGGMQTLCNRGAPESIRCESMRTVLAPGEHNKVNISTRDNASVLEVAIYKLLLQNQGGLSFFFLTIFLCRFAR